MISFITISSQNLHCTNQYFSWYNRDKKREEHNYRERKGTKMRTKSIRFTREELQILESALFALRDKYSQKIDNTLSEERKNEYWEKIIQMSKIRDDIADTIDSFPIE